MYTVSSGTDRRSEKVEMIELGRDEMMVENDG